MAGAGIGEIIPTSKLTILYRNVGWFEDIRLMETEAVPYDISGKVLQISICTDYGQPPLLLLSSSIPFPGPALVKRDQNNMATRGWFDIQCIESNFATIPAGDYVFDLVVINGLIREGWLRGDIELRDGATPSP